MKGIIFSEPMFYATIKGQKTQTRRIMKPQPICDEIGNPTADWDNLLCKPRYQVGETVYLKEPYYAEYGCVCYEFALDFVGKRDIVFKNKLFMPAEYARYFIKITGVKCERLQDISDDDCLKEGIKLHKQPITPHEVYGYDIVPIEENGYVDFIGFVAPHQAYAALIDKINRKGTWETNPYVWVYDYKLIT